MKGILLAGGAGTRLYPSTRVISKQLLPVYDKPMVYYPLSVLMLAGIRDILIISTPQDTPSYRHLFGDGSRWGLRMEYAVQERPEGLAQAFLLGASFIGCESSCLILGDNLFFGQGFSPLLQEAAEIKDGALVFGYKVRDPERFGVVEVDESFRALAIEEKPRHPRSPWAVTGLYFYDPEVVSLARSLKPSARGELEITDLNRIYLEAGKLRVVPLGRGFAWLDTGTHDSLLDASNFIAHVQKRQGYLVGCLEEIALQKGWIGPEQVERMACELGRTEYGEYLLGLVK
jgi:glucose-1-phosphate thymidylyltransferase